MLPSEKLAIAAHLHVLLRRKTGRVTDTQWMACNAEYAAEVVRVARQSAKEDGHADLAEWADKLERAMFPKPAATPTVNRPAAAVASLRSILTGSMGARDADAMPADPSRYVRGIR
jgi:hypothetical protein